jgi:RNA polymerase sigma-70 factor (ECF subfamily)
MVMIGASFDAILGAAQHGDEGAFSALWRDIQPGLLRYLRVATGEAAAGGRAMSVVEGADDVAADTWLEVVRGLRDFTGNEAAFRGWVFTLARRRAVDAGRRAARRPAQPVPNETLEWVSNGDDPAVAVLQADATSRALALIASLPPDQAEVVMLRVVGGLDVAHVAAILGKRAGAVRVLAHRGLRRLFDRLREMERASSSSGGV